MECMSKSRTFFAWCLNVLHDYFLRIAFCLDSIRNCNSYKHRRTTNSAVASRKAWRNRQNTRIPRRDVSALSVTLYHFQNTELQKHTYVLPGHISRRVCLNYNDLRKESVQHYKFIFWRRVLHIWNFNICSCRDVHTLPDDIGLMSAPDTDGLENDRAKGRTSGRL